MCSSMSRKLDKLTVLRMAVQHLKSIRGTANAYTEGQYKPAFLSDRELKMLILQAADGFLFVVGCDRGRIMYVSESVNKVLNYSQTELLGQSWFDVVHPKDVSKVKEQLSASDMNPREKLIDAKSMFEYLYCVNRNNMCFSFLSLAMLPVRTDEPHGLTRLCPGARRSFFCRMKSKPQTDIHIVKEEIAIDTSATATSVNTSSCSNNSGGSGHARKSQSSTDKKYIVIHCTGYLKPWAPSKTEVNDQESESENESSNISCLVAIGRIPPNIYNTTDPTSGCDSTTTPLLNIRSIQFMSRHTIDGKFLFVDQRYIQIKVLYDLRYNSLCVGQLWSWGFYPKNYWALVCTNTTIMTMSLLWPIPIKPSSKRPIRSQLMSTSFEPKITDSQGSRVNGNRFEIRGPRKSSILWPKIQ